MCRDKIRKELGILEGLREGQSDRTRRKRDRDRRFVCRVGQVMQGLGASSQEL